MNDEELRLKCIEFALELSKINPFNEASITKNAEAFFTFVKTGEIKNKC